MKIVACCDKNPEILRRKIQTEDIRNYTKLSDMVKNEVLDLVLILSPSGLHYQHTKYILKRGINVLCEKPMSLKVSHCEELINISKNKKIFYGVVFQNRLNKAIQFLKNRLAAINLEKLYFAM